MHVSRPPLVAVLVCSRCRLPRRRCACRLLLCSVCWLPFSYCYCGCIEVRHAPR